MHRAGSSAGQPPKDVSESPPPTSEKPLALVAGPKPTVRPGSVAALYVPSATFFVEIVEVLPAALTTRYVPFNRKSRVPPEIVTRSTPAARPSGAEVVTVAVLPASTMLTSVPVATVQALD